MKQKKYGKGRLAGIIGFLMLIFVFAISGVNASVPQKVKNETVTVTKKNKKKNKNNKSNNNSDNTKNSNSDEQTEAETEGKTYYFRSKKYLEQHFEKHGAEFDGLYETAEEYEKGASDVVNNKDALHKIEKEDGDDIYYVEETNEFVVVSGDGYLRTYFKPSAGIKYYNRQ